MMSISGNPILLNMTHPLKLPHDSPKGRLLSSLPVRSLGRSE